jgi:hypothetical protein
VGRGRGHEADWSRRRLGRNSKDSSLWRIKSYWVSLLRVSVYQNRSSDASIPESPKAISSDSRKQGRAS